MNEIIINIHINDARSVVEALNNCFMNTKVIHLPKYLLVSISRMRYDAITQSQVKIYSRLFIDKTIIVQQREYRLMAIIAHIGNTSGHFVIYIKDTDKEWICFNDEKVNIVSQNEVNELIEGDNEIEHYRYCSEVSEYIKDIADTIRTASFLLYSLVIDE